MIKRDRERKETERFDAIFPRKQRRRRSDRQWPEGIRAEEREGERSRASIPYGAPFAK